ncbi:unnamed protein product, partial [Laminaria digitata]
CYCEEEGDEYDLYGEIDGDECNMPCSGHPDERCGGYRTMNVYAITGEGSPMAEDDDGEGGGGSDLAFAFPPPTAENYLGCYGDDAEDRALTLGVHKSESAMSVEV